MLRPDTTFNYLFLPCHTAILRQGSKSRSSFRTIIPLILTMLYMIIFGVVTLYMGQFAQFGLNGFKRGQTHFSQLHISLDPDKLKS